jgi:hypothetical protein
VNKRTRVDIECQHAACLHVTYISRLVQGFEVLNVSFFFCGEGPRSRRYGRTAALRLLVKPCDDDDDDYFLSFS